MTPSPASPAHQPAIDALLDDAFGADRRQRTAYRLRGATPPLVSLVVEDGPVLCGTMILTPVRLLPAGSPEQEALLLGPIAIAPGCRGRGLGGTLIHAGLQAVKALGADIVMLIGDPPYYGRFGFSNMATAGWRLPGPVEQHRIMALSLAGQLVPQNCTLLPLDGPDYWLAGRDEGAIALDHAGNALA